MANLETPHLKALVCEENALLRETWIDSLSILRRKIIPQFCEGKHWYMFVVAFPQISCGTMGASKPLCDRVLVVITIDK